MLPVPKLRRLIPSPMDHPHHAQFPNLCCAKAHPQLHDKTATAKLKWHKDCKLSQPALRTIATTQIPLKSWETSHICNVYLCLRNIRKAPQHSQRFPFEKPCNTCHIFWYKTLQHFKSTATPDVLKFRNTCYLCNIFLGPCDNHNALNDSATPATL